ncbi:beta-galactosidase 8-like isoform X1 [Salvia hispanica]|uniref:beta-galactosidase 8-like isoform X1 n=2 Tax=Salvia hispanica TaxID=49212 RepID=UPI0020090075|nr:beta-galactosidase 8-like isoform X1 [Salvia hispanica]
MSAFKSSKSMLLSALVFAVLLFDCGLFQTAVSRSVSYDSKALIIDGKRRILQSGSVHYPRTTPDVWPEIIGKAKEGGIDVIETYVFWNYHEPVKGEYYFEGRFDLIRFVKEVHKAGLFVHLRIGPYACAEWNYGGFPMWLHFIPGIQFRTKNDLFQTEMERFLAKIVRMMKDANLFASQGGPIILAQVENEYGNVQAAYGADGALYVKWAAETAVGLNTSVPWVMCAQQDAPDPIINTCNGFYCDGFTPNSPTKPSMWTENYVGWFLAFGYAVPFRPVEDLAFAVARFFERGGTFQNYYMYFGGSNFGRTAGGPLVATSYDYDAPINEYGFLNQPKWGHLRDLHIAIKLCEEHLVNADATQISLGENLEAHVYYKSSDDCAAFLANYGSSSDATVDFRGKSYFLPAWSVSILPDCVNVVFNTAKVTSQTTLNDESLTRNITMHESSMSSASWSWYKEEAGVWGNSSFEASGLLEHINTTKDTSDFLWYTISIDVNADNKKNRTKEVGLLIGSLGHAALLFVNKQPAAFDYGNHDDASFNLSATVEFHSGSNTVDILSMMVGLQNYGPWFDIQGAGIHSVVLTGLKGSEEDLSSSQWTYQVGLEGEYLGLQNVSLANSSIWTDKGDLPLNRSLTWYKTTFLAPEGNGPVSLNLSGMGKGQAWVNGLSIGRYWSQYLSPSSGCTEPCDYRGTYDASKCLKKCGQPAQTLYHIPRSWLQQSENLLVIHEELGGDPRTISVVAQIGQVICGRVTEDDLPQADTWEQGVGFASTTPELRLSCETGQQIDSIRFASLGNPQGSCGAHRPGTCHADVSTYLKKECVGKERCSIPISTETLGDPCRNLTKTLAVEALCLG